MRTDFQIMCEADVAFRFTVASGVDNVAFPYRVEILKNRFGGRSRHAFTSMADALKFMQQTLEVKP